MSQINVDTVRNRTSTNGGPTFDKGLTVSAGTTAYVYGNLQVDGTETIVNTERLDVADKTVGIASTTAASNSTADGAGIEVYGGSDGNKTVVYLHNSRNGFTFYGGETGGYDNVRYNELSGSSSFYMQATYFAS